MLSTGLHMKCCLSLWVSDTQVPPAAPTPPPSLDSLFTSPLKTHQRDRTAKKARGFAGALWLITSPSKNQSCSSFVDSDYTHFFSTTHSFFVFCSVFKGVQSFRLHVLSIILRSIMSLGPHFYSNFNNILIVYFYKVSFNTSA